MQNKISIKVESWQILADTITPVSIYLNLREKYKEVLLLESSDYRGKENSVSYICAERFARFEVKDFQIKIEFDEALNIKDENFEVNSVVNQLKEFQERFNFEFTENDNANSETNNPASNLFGFTTFNGFKYFDDLKILPHADEIPDLRYDLFKYVISFNHFNNELTVFSNSHQGSKNNSKSDIENFVDLMTKTQAQKARGNFKLIGEETTNLTDTQHIELINRCKQHIARGDVFQIVPSRQFKQKFSGDDFEVYRTLRSVNPSPFLFYFNYEDFKIIGSSPELQIKIQDGQASIHPIAGTYKRDPEIGDEETALRLLNDAKEGAEHVMLVDLARNDLSRHCDDVKVEKFKTVEFYSHVVHLVSKVSGNLTDKKNALQVFADTFPAGTLSGAPKYKAIELLSRYESTVRSFYGGAIGFICQNGDIVHAIIIRSLLSRNNELIFQAGCGIVADSIPEVEVEEVKNKLEALRKAIKTQFNASPTKPQRGEIISPGQRPG